MLLALVVLLLILILWIVMLIHDQVESICEKIGAKK